MSRFAEEMERMSTMKSTENGGLAYTTSGGGACLDLFAVIGGMRKASESELISKYRAARAENAELADRMVLYVRDARMGQGERKIGRVLMHEMATIAPDKVRRNITKFADMGRWDDLYALEGTKVEKAMWDCFAKQFRADLKGLVKGEPISLLAKWLKSVNTSNAESVRLGKRTAYQFGLSERKYRKALAALRAKLNVVEVDMSARNFDKINFEAVPSVAMKKYRNAFARQSEAFREYVAKLEKGEAKINAGALYPYDLVRTYLNSARGWYSGGYPVDPVIEAQWKSLPNFVEGENDVVVMADVSGSMSSDRNRPMSTSIGLAIYFAERNMGAYKGMYMSFTDSPHFIKVKEGSTLAENVKFVEEAGIGYNTNLDGALQAVYDMAVRVKEAPKAIAVISDGEIDCFIRYYDVDDIVMKWERKYTKAGLAMPKIIFWNVASRNGGTYLGKATNPNVAFVSGSSASTFQNFTSLCEKTAYEAMLDILMKERYAFE